MAQLGFEVLGFRRWFVTGHVGGDGLSPYRVGLAADQHVSHAGKRGDRGLNLGRVDVVGAGVDHAVEASVQVEAAVGVGGDQVAESAPTVGVGVVGHHRRPAHSQLAPGGAVDVADLEFDPGYRASAAPGQGLVAAGDGGVGVGAENGQGPAALESPVELDEDGTQTPYRRDHLVKREWRPAVQQAPQGQLPSGVQGSHDPGDHGGDEEGGGRPEPVHRVEEGGGLEAA